MINRYKAVIVAAGVGRRLSESIPKQFLEINGKSLIEITLSKFLRHNKIEKVYLVVNKDFIDLLQTEIKDNPQIEIVYGGDTRALSVLNALKVIDSDEYVLIHDCARIFVENDDIDNLIASVERSAKGAILVQKSTDSLKKVENDKAINLPRDNIYKVLTPQMFKACELKNALIYCQSQNIIVNDDSYAIELKNLDFNLVESKNFNLKITHKQDFVLAKKILGK